MDTIAKRLRWARLRKGMTQKELADRAHCTVDQIAQTEAGRSTRPRRLVEIAQALDVSTAWLAFGEGPCDHLEPEAMRIAEQFQDAPQAIQLAIRALLQTQPTD